MAEKNTEAMGWDDPIENESGSGYTVIPAVDANGKSIQYRFVVEEFKRGRHQPKAGGKIPACNKAMLTFGIYDDNGDRLGKIEQDLFLVRSLEWKLASFFRAIGMKKHGERVQPDWSKVESATGWLTVKIRNWAKKDDRPGEKTGQSNEVDNFIDPDKVGEPEDTPPAPGAMF